MHWFDGDGMLHAFYIHKGKVSYRNRWVRTERFNLERKAGKRLFGSIMDPSSKDPSVRDISGNPANTNIIQHAGKLLALVELSSPIEINPLDLATLGKWDGNGKISHMSAHPHFDHKTDEMHNYAYTPGSNEVVYFVFNCEGVVTKAETIHAPFSSFMHDFFITKDYVLFPVLPLTMSLERAKQGKPMAMWEPEKGAHIGIMPRNGTAKDLVWFELDAFYAFHYMNAYQEGDNIILDGMKSRRAHLFPDAKGKIATSSECPPQFTRWTFNILRKTVSEKQLDSRLAEFPRFDERFTGLPYRHGFAGTCVDPKSKDEIFFDAIIHYDHNKKSQTIRAFGAGNAPSEPIFVPRHKNSKEGDGFILTVVYNAANDCSDLYILDAMNIDKEPLAVVQCPHRIPNGFHGNWCEF